MRVGGVAPLSGRPIVSRTIVTLWMSLVGGALLCPDIASGAGQSDSRVRAERAIRQLVQSFEQAWNEGDAARLASLFAPSGQFVSPSGARADTREEIRRLLAREHEQMFEGTRFNGHVEDVQVQDDETATVHGTYSLHGLERLHGFVEASQSGTFRCVLDATDGEWLIVKADISSRNATLDVDLY